MQWLKELGRLIWAHKGYFLAPMLIVLVLLVILLIRFGPSSLVPFIYSGL